MSLRALLLAATALGFASAAHAADLIVDTAPASVDPSFVDSSIYAQLLGGAIGGDIQWWEDGEDDGNTETNPGWAVAGTIGVVVMDGLSLEADVLHTSRTSVDDGEDDVYTTTSLMANAKYTLHLNDTFSVYGAAGLGYIWQNENYFGTDYAYNGIGYQLIAGVGMKLTDNITGLVEYRFQDSLDRNNYTDDDYYGASFGGSTVLAGIKVGF
jgi:opacity protein-like surface antigen